MVTGDVVPVTLPEQMPAFIATVRKVMTAVVKWVNDLYDRLRGPMVETANHPVTVAGLEARYAVRAGLSPAYRHPGDLDRLVAAIMAGHGDTLREDRELRHVTRANRSLIAAAAIQGWCYSYGDGPAIVAWHRLMGTTTVVVTRG